MRVTRFAIVGSGWRSAFYLRVAAALRQRFEVSGLLSRDAARQAGEWLDGGPDVCSLAEAAQDHHIGLAIDEAARTGRAVTLNGHVWDEPSVARG